MCTHGFINQDFFFFAHAILGFCVQVSPTQSSIIDGPRRVMKLIYDTGPVLYDLS